LRVQEKRREK